MEQVRREWERPVISVIVPVYNVMPYIERCLESIAAQTWPYMEVIIVDDSSTDGSGRICDLWGEQDKRMEIVHLPENRGLSAARNEGVARARGAFITFIDSDDYVESDLLEKLYYSLRREEADISICGTDGIAGRNTPAVVYSREETIHCLARRSPFLWTAWGKLFPTALVKAHPFEKRAVCCEDLLFFYEIWKHVEKVSYIPDKLYHYVQRKDSLINRPIDSKRCIVLSVLDDICRDAAMNFPEMAYEFEQIAMDTGVRLAMEALEAGTAEGELLPYLKRFQESVRRHFSMSVLRHCPSFKSMTAQLSLYLDITVFRVLAITFQGMKVLQAKWDQTKKGQGTGT